VLLQSRQGQTGGLRAYHLGGGLSQAAEFRSLGEGGDGAPFVDGYGWLLSRQELDYQ
jgi:hypothetical protein